MRSNLIIFGVVAAVTYACAKTSPSVSVASGTVTPEGTHDVPAQVADAPISAAELSPMTHGANAIPPREPVRRRTMGPARIDEYLSGEVGALNEQEQRGLALFVRVGCTSCHDGPYVGGQEYRKLGVAVPMAAEKDSGRYAVTRDPADLFTYKVPSLRNVESRELYFHDSSVAYLGQAVRLMARHQLGADLTEDQVRDIRAFLGSLTGRLPVNSGTP